MTNEFMRTNEEWDALTERLKEMDRVVALEQPTCLVCLAGQRVVKEMLWCDRCPAQLCIRHANSITTKDWAITSWNILCPACRYTRTVRITVS